MYVRVCVHVCVWDRLKHSRIYSPPVYLTRLHQLTEHLTLHFSLSASFLFIVSQAFTLFYLCSSSSFDASSASSPFGLSLWFGKWFFECLQLSWFPRFCLSLFHLSLSQICLLSFRCCCLRLTWQQFFTEVMLHVRAACFLLLLLSSELNLSVSPLNTHLPTVYIFTSRSQNLFRHSCFKLYLLSAFESYTAVTSCVHLCSFSVCFSRRKKSDVKST